MRDGNNSELPFHALFATLGSCYIILIAAMLIAGVSFTSPADLIAALNNAEIRYAFRLSILTCTIATILSLWVAVPLAYQLARFDFRGKSLIEAIVDVPIVLPPLVVGLLLLILFQTPIGRLTERWIPVTYEIPSVILAQFSVACAFAIRTLRVTFDQMDSRQEDVARTLGCTRFQAFLRVVLPEATPGIIAAATIAWARALGEFGPILVFSGATRMKTEVLPTTVFLELSVGNLEAALAVSLLMVIIASVVLGVARLFGMKGGAW
ncbi:MAG: ABC transporter permease [Planctomycetota bacterium]